MTIALGTEFQELGDLADGVDWGQPIRAQHIERLVKNESYVRSSRLRAMWSLGVPVTTTNLVGYDVVFPAGSACADMSPLSSRVLRLRISGSRVQARLTIEDTSGNSTTVTLAQSSATEQSAESADITAAWITDSAELMFGLEVLATSGTGTLNTLLVYEKNQDASTIR